MTSFITEKARSWLRSCLHRIPAHAPVEVQGERTHLLFDRIEIDLHAHHVRARYLAGNDVLGWQDAPIGGVGPGDTLVLHGAGGRIAIEHLQDNVQGWFPTMELAAATVKRHAGQFAPVLLGSLVGYGIMSVVPGMWVAPIAVLGAFALFAHSLLQGKRA